MMLKSVNSKQQINAAPLCLDFQNDFLADNMKKLDYVDTSIIFQLTMIVLTLIIFWIFLNI